ncbi:MAG: MFS transporter [Pseudomonadota bacterium]
MGLLEDIRLSRKPLAGFCAIGVAWAVYFAQMPVIKAQVGASDGAYGLAILLASFGAFAAMWLAPGARRWFGGSAVPVGIVLVGAGMFWAGASGSLVALTAGIFLASVGSGIVDVLVNARVSEIEEDEAATLMSLNHALYSFAYAGGALVVAALRTLEIGTLPVSFGLFAVCCALALAGRDKPPPPEPAVKSRDLGQWPVLVVLVGVIVLIAFLAEASTEGWSALHLERTLGGSAGEGALGPAILGLAMGVGRLSGHWLSRRFRDTALMLVAALIASSGVAVAAVAPTVTIALAGFAIAGLGASVMVPLAFALLGRMVPATLRLTAISRASVIGYGAFFFGPPLMGLVAEGFGLRMSFVLIAGLLALTAVLLVPALARRSG